MTQYQKEEAERNKFWKERNCREKAYTDFVQSLTPEQAELVAKTIRLFPFELQNRGQFDVSEGLEKLDSWTKHRCLHIGTLVKSEKKSDFDWHVYVCSKCGYEQTVAD